MPTITVTVIEHGATERKPWRVTVHDGTHRFTMPVLVGEPMIETDHRAMRGLVRAVRSLDAAVPEGPPRSDPWAHTGHDWCWEQNGYSRRGHRRYKVTY